MSRNNKEEISNQKFIEMNLPVIIKQSTKQYFGGVDVASENDKERITVCIMSKDEKGNRIIEYMKQEVFDKVDHKSEEIMTYLNEVGIPTLKENY